MDEWLKENIKEICLDDLPESYREIAQVVGVENAIKLSDRLGGCSYYFIQTDNMLLNIRNKLIIRQFNGANYRDLARKYRLSDIQIRKIVDKKGGLKLP